MFTFSGNVGKDPEVKTVGSRKVMEFTVALYAGKKDGEAQTQWIKASQWFDSSYEIKDWQIPSKGDFVIVSGTINPARIYESNAGFQGVDLSCMADRVEISRKGGTQTQQHSIPAAKAPTFAGPSPSPMPKAVTAPGGEEDDLPF